MFFAYAVSTLFTEPSPLSFPKFLCQKFNLLWKSVGKSGSLGVIYGHKLYDLNVLMWMIKRTSGVDSLLLQEDAAKRPSSDSSLRIWTSSLPNCEKRNFFSFQITSHRFLDIPVETGVK